MENETIAAIATAKGAAGIGIVKISGPKAILIARRLFFPGKHQPEGTTPGDWKTIPKHMHYGWIRRAESRQAIDEVLLSVMPGPRSYTGEDVVEINGHGGQHCLAIILEEVIGCGARPAEPGEFTRRAWLNGRISLCEAEAVIELIQARSRTALHAAARRLEGALGRQILAIREKLIDLMAEIEVGIEFPEEDEIKPIETIIQALKAGITTALRQLIDEYRRQRGYTEGIRVAVVGRPNVGKSSLVNRLTNSERVLVSTTPGTTRDLVDVELRLGDLPITLTDTAGLHYSRDEIEILSMEKSRGSIHRSDLILFMIDVSEGVAEEDENIRSLIKDTAVLVIFNKMDLMEGKPVKGIPPQWPQWPAVYISARHDQHFETLERAILARLEMKQENEEDEIVPNLRQSRSLQMAKAAVERGIGSLEIGSGGEVLAIDDLKEALVHIDQALGRRNDNGVMEQIFSRFCIGK